MNEWFNMTVVIKEIKEIHKQESLSVTGFINFLGPNNFFSRFPHWGEGQTSNIKGYYSQKNVGLWLTFALFRS